jgi:hypothetical protein
MLAHLLAFDIIPEDDGGGVIIDTGNVVTLAFQAIEATRGVSVRPVGDLAGVSLWPMPLDPSDIAPYAFDFSPLLMTTERVVAILRVSVSPAAAALGVRIGTGTRGPIIDTAGKKVMVWLSVDPEMQSLPAFDGAGTSAGVSFLVRTSAVPYREYERTAAVTVKSQ